MFKVCKKDNRIIIDVVLKTYLLTLNIFYTFCYCFDCYFEHVMAAGIAKIFFTVVIE